MSPVKSSVFLICIAFAGCSKSNNGSTLKLNIGESGALVPAATPPPILSTPSPSPSPIATPRVKVRQIVAGNTSFAILDDNSVWCWGLNDSGQFGNGTTDSSPLPIQLPELGKDVAQIAVGMAHVCSLTVSGSVKCWGRNSLGQLGDDTTNDSLMPVQVSGLTSGVKAISLGVNHSLALMNNGTVRSWGGGQVVPTQVDGLPSSVVEISAGYFHSCALTNIGSLFCWGQNYKGALGNGTEVDSFKVALPVSNLSSGVASVSAGAHRTYALLKNGSVMGWGTNINRSLGVDSNVDKSLIPITIPVLAPGKMISINSKESHACGIESGGKIQCWGYNAVGQLGVGYRGSGSVPVQVDGLVDGASKISVGATSSCAILKDGFAYCWGDNSYGQLGNNSVVESWVPVRVTGI
jgi:alpha-tubulin suppressor-like RCC1 family protein